MRMGKAAVRRGTKIQKLITVDAVVDGELTRGWVHTHGMDKLGLPELEIRNVTPNCLLVEASKLLNFVAQYVASAPKKVELGDTMSFGPNPAECFRFAKLPPIPGEEEHYRVERWTLVDIEQACLCGECAALMRGTPLQ